MEKEEEEGVLIINRYTLAKRGKGDIPMKVVGQNPYATKIKQEKIYL